MFPLLFLTNTGCSTLQILSKELVICSLYCYILSDPEMCLRKLKEDKEAKSRHLSLISN